MRQFLLSTSAVILGLSSAIAQETSPQVTPIPAPVVAAYNQADDASVASAVRLNALINSTVRVKVPGGSGSGTVFKAVDPKGGKHILVLTNEHVVDKIVTACSKSDKTKAACIAGPATVKIDAWITNGGRTYPVTYPARIAFADSVNDIACLVIDGEWAGETSQFAPVDLDLHQSETVYEVGSPLGERTQITSGMISLIDTVVYGRHYLAMSSTTIPGNSGGGLYVKRAGEYYLIGVPTSVGVAFKGEATFTHGFAISVNRVRGVLAGLGLSPL